MLRIYRFPLFSFFACKTFCLFVFGIALFANVQVVAQSPDEIASRWTAFQDSLDAWGEQMVRNQDLEIRQNVFELIKNEMSVMLHDSLMAQKEFRDLPFLSILIPRDSSFRVITWQLYVDKDTYVYHGFLQKLGKEAKVFELKPGLRTQLMVEFRELSLDQWKPGLYYNIHTVKTDSTPYYIMFAFNGYGYFERSKFMDVLRFNQDGVPYFGAPVFHKYLNEDNTGGRKETKHRHVMVYSAESSVTLNYSQIHSHLVYNHLTNFQGTHEGQGLIWVPDGTYEGYKLEGSEWYYVRRVFTETMEEPPLPNPVLDRRKDRDIFGNPRDGQ